MDILKKNNDILRAVAEDGFWEGEDQCLELPLYSFFWNSADA